VPKISSCAQIGSAAEGSVNCGRKARKNKQGGLRIEHFDRDAVEERTAGRPRADLLQRGRWRIRLSEQADAKPDQVSGARQLHDRVQGRDGMEQDREPGRRRDHMNIAAQMNAERSQEPGPAASRDRARGGVEHRRAGHVGKHGRCGEKSQNEVGRGHGVILMAIAAGQVTRRRRALRATATGVTIMRRPA
jgi:hypothetical protein